MIPTDARAVAVSIKPKSMQAAIAARAITARYSKSER